MTEHRKIELPQTRQLRLRVDLEAIDGSPLVVHRFGAKAQRQMLARQMGLPSPKEKRDPLKEYRECFYIVDPTAADDAIGKYGFPTKALKGAMVSACRFMPKNSIKMTVMKGALFVEGELFLLTGWDRLEMHAEPVRLGMRGSTEVRFRPAFHGWTGEAFLTLKVGSISLDQALHALVEAGSGVGLGECRPEKGGTWGMFAVSAAEAVAEDAVVRYLDRSPKIDWEEIESLRSKQAATEAVPATTRRRKTQAAG